jgi:hypothetical protein
MDARSIRWLATRRGPIDVPWSPAEMSTTLLGFYALVPASLRPTERASAEEAGTV